MPLIKERREAMKQHKAIALSLSMILCFVMLLSAFFIVTEANHDCSGEDCHICMEMKACLTRLRSLISSLFPIAIVLGIYVGLSQAKQLLHFFLTSHTLVFLKVKLTI